MTNFRPTVLYTAACCIGSREGTDRHQVILDIYNMYKPKNRPYKITAKDPWCAAFVSACFIASGCAELIPIECSCYHIKEEAKKRGILRDPARYVPSPGDLILYKWEGKSVVSHIGIVEDVTGSNLTVIEGNYQDTVGRRHIKLSYKYIDSYIEVPYG